MKKILLFLIFLSSTFSGIAQIPVVSDINPTWTVSKEPKKYKPQQPEPVIEKVDTADCEEYTEYYYNKIVKGKGPVKNKLKEGEWTYWRMNHSNETYIGEKGNYKQGMREGLWIEWENKGEWYWHGNYKSGLKDGLWEKWYKTNDVFPDKSWKYESQSYKMGMLHGYQIVYNGDKSFREKKYFVNGEAEGEWVYNGYWFSQNKRIENYKNGKLNGKVLSYFTDDTLQISEEFNYLNGKLNGPYISYNDSGKVREKGTYENDMKQGEWVWEGNRNGTHIKNVIRYKNDKPDGRSENFENGKLIGYSNHLNGTNYGKSLYRGEYGGYFTEQEWKNDTLNGIYFNYRTGKNGEIIPIQTGQYKMGLQDGKWLDYDYNGQVAHEIIYKNGIKNGISKEFTNGILVREQIWVNGVVDGKTTENYSSGKLYHVVHFKKQKKHGKELFYYEDGKIQYDFEYENGIKVSEKTYDKEGNLKSDIPKPVNKSLVEEGIYNKKKYRKTFTDTNSSDNFLYEEWTLEGNKTMEYTIKNKALEGSSKIWNFKGELVSEINYKNNKPVGKYKMISHPYIMEGEYSDSSKRIGTWEFHSVVIIDSTLMYNTGYGMYVDTSPFNLTKGVLLARGKVKDDSPWGYWEYYYPNGKLRFKGEQCGFLKSTGWGWDMGGDYRQLGITIGERCGDYVEYYPNEQLQSKKEKDSIWDYYDTGIMKMRKDSLYHESWNENGKLISKYLKDENTSISYYANGNIHWHFYSKNNIQQRWNFFENGQLNSYENYEHKGNKTEYHIKKNYTETGKLVYYQVKDTTLAWYPDGKVQTKKFKDFMISYNEDGSKSRYYKKGENGDKTVFYYRNGKIQTRSKMNDEYKWEGLLERFYEDGTKSEEGNYVNGKKTGHHKEWHKNGKLKCEGDYANDERTGNWKYYKETGGLEKSLDYTYGEIITITKYE